MQDEDEWKVTHNTFIRVALCIRIRCMWHRPLCVGALKGLLCNGESLLLAPLLITSPHWCSAWWGAMRAGWITDNCSFWGASGTFTVLCLLQNSQSSSQIFIYCVKKNISSLHNFTFGVWQDQMRIFPAKCSTSWPWEETLGWNNQMSSLMPFSLHVLHLPAQIIIKVMTCCLKQAKCRCELN